jgi:secreted trypsin-like serine protease
MINKEFENWVLSNAKLVLGNNYFSMSYAVVVTVYDVNTLEGINERKIVDEPFYDKMKNISNQLGSKWGNTITTHEPRI